MKTLAELEALPELQRGPAKCMRCEKPIPFAASEIIVYRHPVRGNVSFEDARKNADVDEIVTAHVCFDCNDELYK